MTLKKHLCILGAIILLMGGNTMTAQKSARVKEYDLKAAFLYRFIDYIDWGGNSKNKLISIDILGECPIAKSLTDITNSNKIDVKVFSNLNEMGLCNILFVPKNSPIPIETILSAYSKKPVLIVSEQKGYGHKGTHMNFVIVDDKLKFEINLVALKKDGIGISSFLLQHGIIVE